MTLACRLSAAGHRPNVFGPYGSSADHKLIDLKATNGELLRCGVADTKTSHCQGTDRECTDSCSTCGKCTSSQRPQSYAASSDPSDGEPSHLESRQICRFASSVSHAFPVSHHVLHALPTHDVLPLPWPVLIVAAAVPEMKTCVCKCKPTTCPANDGSA
ncbi:MAG TPA: hypothetical protein VHU77_07935, partial [Candidatus Limnocylindria bacterium]|nr:hypothetical protein [Candidatus Limnocylindria bacterium]